MREVSSSQFIVYRLQKGFTLLEILVVMSIVSVAGIIVAGILVSTLRGSSKVNIVSSVKQNGDYAVAQMARIIRSASSVNILPCGNPSPAVQSITVTQIDTSQTIFDCSGSTITSNGTSLLDTSSVQLVPSTCQLICSQQSTADVPVIQIKFSLMQKNSSNQPDQASTIPFQTSVILRNIQQ